MVINLDPNKQQSKQINLTPPKKNVPSQKSYPSDNPLGLPKPKPKSFNPQLQNLKRVILKGSLKNGLIKQRRNPF